MERDELVVLVKEKEKEFINHIENVIKHNHLENLFKKYKETLNNVQKCYSNKDLKFDESKKCAENEMQIYLKEQNKFERLFTLYQVFSIFQ